MTDQNNDQKKHRNTAEPAEYAGQQGIKCYCGYVHPVDDKGEIDSSQTINEKGEIVSISKLELEFKQEMDRMEWEGYDRF